MIRWLLLLLLPALCGAQTANVGSKRFTESYILGEILTQTARQAGEAEATHRQGLGNTAIVFAALRNGAVDLYPEYTGTIAFELLGLKQSANIEELRQALAKEGLGVGVPLGFNNTYSLAMTSKRAQELGISRISDLARHPELRFGLTQEFLSRKDGWPAVKAAYGLPQAARGLDHGLAYDALNTGKIDVIDVYSTDAKITRYQVRLLEDDKRFFPAYDAVLLYRLDFPKRFPRTWAAIQSLEGRIDAPRMAAMNAEVELAGKTFSDAAATFVSGQTAPNGDGRAQKTAARSFLSVLFGADLGRLTLQHLALVLGSLGPAVAIGVPLGIVAARSRRASTAIMAIVGLMQTVPALALLAFLITLMGAIGTVPALVALFLYALLPIVRNTASGLADLPPPLQEAARALGLPALSRLHRVELPLASRSILAGIKTSAVIAVGTATIAAFIGAGGYGERIVSGLAVNDTSMLLAGAIPAAALALAMQWAFDGLEHLVVPEGLRLRTDVAEVE
jgi:osmoprotectant transport system permease protein